VVPFGYGLHYTKFKFDWEETLNREYNIQGLVASGQRISGGSINDNTPFTTVKARVKNVGHETSDYVSLLFLSSKDAGPAPRPNKSLLSYVRLHNIAHGSDQVAYLPLTLGSLARADENGSLVIFPGHYKISLDNSEDLTFEFTLKGSPAVIETLPTPDAQYNFTVPVHIQPASTEAHS
jgi:beta-D-xylosidase 4